MYSRLIYGGKKMPFNYCLFICDTIADLESLPTNIKKGHSNNKDYDTCSFGSKARVLENKTDYILNTNNEWKKYSQADSSDFPKSQIYVTDDDEGNVTIHNK